MNKIFIINVFDVLAEKKGEQIYQALPKDAQTVCRLEDLRYEITCFLENAGNEIDPNITQPLHTLVTNITSNINHKLTKLRDAYYNGRLDHVSSI